MKRSLSMLVALGLLIASCSAVQKISGSTAPAPKPSAPVVSDGRVVLPKGTIPANAKPVKIALLVPLSGESMAIGNAMLDAATMAVFDSYVGTPAEQIRARVILMPKDTGNTPADAVRVTKQAIEQGATFIVGPLFSQSVSAIAPMVKEANIPVLSFSNNKAVAENGIYTFGFLPEQQVERMAEYAYLNGLTRVAMLAPNDSYGEKIKERLLTEYSKRGGIISPVELYAPSQSNIEAAVSRLASSYNNAAENRRFQAIFVAEGGTNLKFIVDALGKTNIDPTKVKLLGTGLWDDPNLSKMPAMQGAWFTSSPPEAYKNFETHFNAMYGYKPMRLASLSYDAVALVATLTMSMPEGGLTTASLTDPKGYFSPANSLFRLLPNGTSDRKLAVMEVTSEGFKVVDQAPKRF